MSTHQCREEIMIFDSYFSGAGNSMYNWIKQLRSGLLLFALAIFCSGCASSTDPREGGFFGGVQGLQSGAYEERVQSREESLDRLRALQAELDAEQSSLGAEKRSLEEEVALERQNLTAMEQEVAGLEQSLDTYQADDTQKQQQINKLRSRLAELKTTMQEQTSALDALEGSGTGNRDQDLRRRQLEEQRRALQEEFELLMDLSLELSK
jgi:DNA repair exonuclease SbcCD ATPase subunit